MVQRTRYWDISGTDKYIEQIGKLPIEIQHNIERELQELSCQLDPRDYAPWDDCGKDDEDCPYIIQIFSGLPFEFMYLMDPNTHKLLFIDCYPLPIFHSLSTE